MRIPFSAFHNSHTSFRWLITSVILTLMLFACSETPRQLALNGQSGFGGTGHSTDPTSGFGGTGHGIKGFGGTGIMGTISAFGSIWVNGIEIDYTDTTPIKSPLSDQKHPLKLGQQVWVETRPEDKGTRPQAAHIAVYIPIAGQITHKQGDWVTVQQQKIHIQPSTRFDEQLKLQVGQYIAINAYPEKGHWQATRINQNPQQYTWFKPQLNVPTSAHIQQLVIAPKMLPLVKNLQLSHTLQQQMSTLQNLQHPIIFQGQMQHHQFVPQTYRPFTPTDYPNPRPHGEMNRPQFHPHALHNELEQMHEMKNMQEMQQNMPTHQMQEMQEIKNMQEMQQNIQTFHNNQPSPPERPMLPPNAQSNWHRP